MYAFIKKSILLISAIIILIIFFSITSRASTEKILKIYRGRESVSIKDRDGSLITLNQNPEGYYAEYIDVPPSHFLELLLKKEDKYFYYHPGVNPVSILRAVKNYISGNKNLASSTITEQLVKILLSNVNNRTIKNKFKELYYALSLELRMSKKEILTMYCNSIFLGNGTQGITSASRLYFGRLPESLTEDEAAELVKTISNPTNNNPFNFKKSENEISEKKIPESQLPRFLLSEKEKKKLQSDFSNYCHTETEFEFSTPTLSCQASCSITVDRNLSAKLRGILKRNLENLRQKNASNGAVVIIKLPENELLSMIGSPDPNMDFYGYKINMAVRPRPIGSTIKPFIYLKGFEKGLRPYTVVEDKEYKYTIGTGFAFYPKNYDYQYRGPVTLHYSLSNSLNVPAVKVLEYVGIENFNNFLLNDLDFKPVQDLGNYQLGIALGELEMDLLTLSHYFTIFSNEGKLKPLNIISSTNNKSSNQIQISTPPYIHLINKILSDRITGMEQFGEKSDLNLHAKNYAVKTGTSREYHDSWVIGYTPDFLVGVWIGNSDDTPMDAVSGQSGAGIVWHEAMNLMLNSKYNKNTPFNFDAIKEFPTSDGIDYGLPNDDFEKNKNLLIEDNLILNPHDGDTFLLEKNTRIPLKAREGVTWKVNETFLGRGEELIFTPDKIGRYTIEAMAKDKTESIKIFIENKD